MSRKAKVKIFKIILLVIVIAIIIGTIIYLMPLFKNISTVEGQLAFKQKIQEWLNVDEATYQGMLATNGFKIDFTIFFSAQNTVSINGGTPNALIADSVYYTGDWVYAQTVQIGTATTATMSFTIN